MRTQTAHQSPITCQWPLLWLLVLVVGCNELNPKADIPSYVHVERVSVATTNSSEGSSSANITEIWLFVDDQFLGAYDIPFTAPILKGGPTNVRMEAGIRDNGISTTPELYPFYDPIARQPDLQPDQIDSFSMTFRYRENTAFALLENYETGLTVFQEVISGTSANRLVARPEAAFEGQMGGLITLTEEAPAVELASTRRFRDLQAKGIPVYLEMNYRSEAPTQFGILGFTSGSEFPVDARYVAGFRPSDEWKKIYFNLSEAVANTDGDEYKLILQTSLPTRNDGTYTRNSAQVRIDNLKLLHFK